MFYVKWTFYLTVFAIVAGLLHYNLPDRDIVRVVNTYEERQDFAGGWNQIFWSGGDSGAGSEPANRDVLFIQTVNADGDPKVYRNEDTSWGWPPYLKFDTANLQTRAADVISTAEEPKWVAMRHYGWRNTFLSIFPNALSMEVVEGPDTRLIPWFNIVFLTCLVLFVWFVVRRIQMFRARRIDPMIDAVDDVYDESRGRLSRWLGTWRR